jgi:hypothetical protein
MSDVNMQDFPHVMRGAELVTMGDRDVVAFIPEATMSDASSGMTLRKIKIGDPIWESEPKTVVAAGTRVLLWARVVGNELASGYRWVPSLNEDNPDLAKLRPLTNVFAPKITYDKSSNTLHMFFWTNFNIDYDGSEYDVEQLYDIGYDGEEAGDKAKRVLCYAIGHFGKFYVEGGVITGFVGDSSDSNTGASKDAKYDLVPYFYKPKVISNMTVSGNGPGIVTDGGGGGSSGSGDAVLAVITGAAEFGFSGWIYGNGYGHGVTDHVTVYATDVAIGATITKSVGVIAHRMMMDVISVHEESSSSGS